MNWFVAYKDFIVEQLFPFRSLSNRRCSAGCRTSPLLVEQWTHCKLNCSEPKYDTLIDLWTVGEKHSRSLEPGCPWSDGKCAADVPGDGCWIVQRVWEAVLWERSESQRFGRATRIDMEETGGGGGAAERWYGFGKLI